MESIEKNSLNWVAEFKDRWSEADAQGMQGQRVEHALEPLLFVLAAERDRADRAAELVRLLADQDQCWSDGGQDCTAHGLPWVSPRKCANGAARDFLDRAEATA